jgi:hypothetical protein
MPRDLYSAAWDFAALNLGTVSGSNAAVFGGSLTGNVGFTTGSHFHGDLTNTSLDGKTFTSFRLAIEGIVSGLTVSFSASSVRYTLSATSNFTVTWSGAQGAAIAALLGFDSTANLTGAATYTSTQRPRYLIVSRLAGQSQVHELYEPAGRVAYAESDNGHAFSTHPVEMPLYRDWTQPFETLSGPTDAEYAVSSSVGGTAVRKRDVGAATKVVWTWQDFFEHVRATFPFLLIDRATSVSGSGDAYKMRGEGAHFDPPRITADYDGHWAIPLVTRYLGAVAAVPP